MPSGNVADDNNGPSRVRPASLSAEHESTPTACVVRQSSLHPGRPRHYNPMPQTSLLLPNVVAQCEALHSRGTGGRLVRVDVQGNAHRFSGCPESTTAFEHSTAHTTEFAVSDPPFGDLTRSARCPQNVCLNAVERNPLGVPAGRSTIVSRHRRRQDHHRGLARGAWWMLPWVEPM